MNQLADRRLEEREQRRNDILDAAVTVTALGSLDGLTMDQVAKQARLSRALLYVYFKDRDELLFGLCERALSIMQAQFESTIAAHSTGVAQIAACGQAYVEFARQQPVYFEALARFEAHSPDIACLQPNEGACVLAGDRLHEVLIAAINRGIADGSIRQDVGSPVLVATTLWAFMHGVLQLAQTKANVLAHDGIVVDALISQAITMATRAIASR